VCTPYCLELTKGDPVVTTSKDFSVGKGTLGAVGAAALGGAAKKKAPATPLNVIGAIAGLALGGEVEEEMPAEHEAMHSAVMPEEEIKQSSVMPEELLEMPQSSTVDAEVMMPELEVEAEAEISPVSVALSAGHGVHSHAGALGGGLGLGAMLGVMGH
jgi:hypothetical protein